MAVTWKRLAPIDDVIAKNLLTQQGDIIYASGASTPAVLHPGTDGQVLTTKGSGANPIWADNAGGGADIAAQTLSWLGL